MGAGTGCIASDVQLQLKYYKGKIDPSGPKWQLLHLTLVEGGERVHLLPFADHQPDVC